jgi:hypothetical protein
VAGQETLAELRAKVQKPVRRYNDVAGYLVGDHVSIHVTRLFLALGISPTVATVSMLVFGIAGSLMLLGGDAWAVGGLACIFAYYVCDCVDGEVARYRGQEKLVWAFYDYLFHLFVKSAFWVCLGVAAFRTVWQTWVLVPALTALLATLLTKFLRDLPLLVTARQVLLKPRALRERFVPQLVPDLDPGPDRDEEEVDPDEIGLSSLGSPMGLLRAAVTNFDLSILVFLAAAVADLFVPRFDPGFDWAGEGWNLKVVLLCAYGVILPLDFADQLVTHVRRRDFFLESGELLRRAHHFRLRR